MKIILCTHGTFAQGIKSSMEVIAGNTDHIETVSILGDTDINDTKNEIKGLIESIKASNQTEPIVLISDIAGGSSTQAIAPFLKSEENIYGLTGLNLPMLLELSLSQGDIQDIIKNVFSNVSESVINLNEYLSK